MKPRTLIWTLLSLLLLAGALLFWHWNSGGVARGKIVRRPTTETVRLASTAPKIVSAQSVSKKTLSANTPSASTNKLAYRLSNTTNTLEQLLGDSRAILLANALIDTRMPLNFTIPKNLQARGDPGAYIVQANGLLNDAFRTMLRNAGATIVSYIPNNAYLVRASADAVKTLSSNPLVSAVIPYEPYYKVQSSLLGYAQTALPEGAELNLGLFGDDAAATIQQIQQLGGQVFAQDTSPFGKIVRVIPPQDWTALAGLPGVQLVEPFRPRELANDLARVTLGVSTDPANAVNYTNIIELTGSNVVVEMNDSGVDASHPDFGVNRVFGDVPSSLVDTNGHGTHVAGIIAGNGTESDTVTNAQGSPNPGVLGQYRGMAPLAKIYSIGFLEGEDANVTNQSQISDAYLQGAAALTNALISNNSWGYEGNNTYDLAAASYDAATRDALPGVSGSQPVLFVFAAGNDGGGDDNGGGGVADSIQSPATAKDVITVGATEQYRNITNSVTNMDDSVDMPWQLMTDSTNQVAGYSSRGNVGIGVEGDAGRFKPDVVAPGTFVISTRSQQWDTNAYFSPTNISEGELSDEVDPGSANFYSVSVPANAVQLTIQVVRNGQSPDPLPALPIQVWNGTDPRVANPYVTGTNIVIIPTNSAALNPVGTIWQYAVSNSVNESVNYDLIVELVTTNDLGDYYDVLHELDDSLGTGPPYYYRYETGTSMAAPAVSGVLALMQDFFTNQWKLRPSPALMKAMVINGARSTGNYSFQVQNAINFQGWGLVNLPDALPLGLTTNLNTACSMFVQDQSPASALATGDRQTFFVTVTNMQSQFQPLRVTLAWTDPPGNPAAAIKLVNNLDLVVTNLDDPANPLIYYGNDIVSGNYNNAESAGSPPVLDSINNVENVYIPPLVGTNYSITVIGRSVNVNAVTAQTNNVVQDYALVISSGDSGTNNTAAMMVSSAPPLVSNPTGDQQVTYIASTNNSPLLNQLAGANTPLLGTNIQFSSAPPQGFSGNWQVTVGMTNQWHFYVVTNTTFTNVAFITFEPETLAIPRMGVFADSEDNATQPEADIDLYVATEPGLTNLDPDVISNCVNNVGLDRASLGRGGTEFVAYQLDSVSNNTVVNKTFYVGVKSETQEAAEFEFVPAFSQTPFSSLDGHGDEIVNPINVPLTIPDGSPAHPGVARVFGLAFYPMIINRVIATDTIWHQNFGDLIGALSHDDPTHLGNSVVLNNHESRGNTFPPPTGNGGGTFIYDDSGAGDIVGAQPSDGPGSLQSFIGQQAQGLWTLTESDDSLTQTGSVQNFSLTIQPHLTGNGLTIVTNIAGGTWYYDFIDVPEGATNLTIAVTNLTGTANPPLELFVKYGAPPTTNDYDARVTISNGTPPSGVITISPPTPGTYYFGIYNPSAAQQQVSITATLGLGTPPATTDFKSGGPVLIPDDAVTTSVIPVNANRTIGSVNVGIAVQHPRISDLVFHLISPDGTRILLMENRGGTSTNGAGGYARAIVLNDGFEGLTAANYTTGQTIDGWTVANQVSVVTDPPNADEGNNFLALANGVISTNLPTVAGQTYALTFAYRGPGIAGWWRGEGNATDSSDAQTNGNNGVLIGNFTFPAGEVGQAFQFEDPGQPFEFAGTNTYVQIPQSPSLDVGQDSGLTIEGWINPTNVSAQEPLVEWLAHTPTNVSITAGPFLNRANGHYYYLLGSTNWTTSESWAEQLGGHLATVNDANEENWIYDNFAQYGGTNRTLWIGLNDAASPGMFIWADGETNLAYTNWLNGQPVNCNGNDDYVAIINPSSGEPGLWTLADNNGITCDFPPTNILNGVAEVDEIQTNGVQLWISVTNSIVSGNGCLYANLVDNNNVSHEIYSAPGLIRSNAYQHVALTYDKNTGVAAFYYDGTNVATTNLGVFIPKTGGDVLLGRDMNRETNNFYAGEMDEMSIYERCLSASEIAAIDADGHAGKFDPSITPAEGLAEAQVSFGGVTDTILGNNTRWQTNTITFTATAGSTLLQFQGIEPGLLLDELNLATITTNFSYLTFTEDTNLTTTPIKFAVPPFVSATSPNTFANNFETVAAADYLAEQPIGNSGWQVANNQVSVVTDPVNAYNGHNNLLALADGTISNTLPTVAGRAYTFTFTCRGPGIVGWWRGENNNANDSINGNNGTTTSISYGTGEVGEAFNFNGVSSKITAPASSSLNVGVGGGLTLDTWVNPVDIYSRLIQLLLEWNDNSGNIGTHLALSVLNYGDLYANVVDTGLASHIFSSAGGLMTANSFQHVALTYNKATGMGVLYRNGVVVATNYLGSFTPETSYPFYFGTRESGAFTPSYFKGLMDEASVYNRALSSSEIKAIYQNGNAGKFDPAEFSASPSQSLAEASVSIDDSVPTIFYGNNMVWETHKVDFVAMQDGTPVRITGLEPGVLLDSVSFAQPSGTYYLPEEPMTPLVGENAQGNWTLEIQDDRAGATNPVPALLSWQLQFNFVTNTVISVPLNPESPATNTVPPGQIVYYTVDVPSWASFATNILVSASSPVDLLFNQTNPPTGSNPGDYSLLTSSTGGRATLSAASTPPLVPGQTYYLGVRNSGATAATVVLEVDFDVTSLTNGVPFTSTLNTNDTGRFFAYDVSTNAYEATFQLLKLSGNADLVARKGTPFPTLFDSDYGSFNASNEDENIYVLTSSSPVPLSAGRWYLGVFKRDPGPVTYSILAKELDTNAPNVIDLTNNVPFNFTAGPGAALTNFFRFTVTNAVVNSVTNYVGAIRFELYNLSGNGDLTVQPNVPPLAPPFFQSSQQPGLTPELIYIRTNNVLTNLAVDWYLGVPNHETNLIAYTVLAAVETNQVFPSFLGAEGAGAGALGGRGGDVYHVMNLNDSGPGSLRYGITNFFGTGAANPPGTGVTNIAGMATNFSGARTIVFDVSGTINLMSPLVITNSYLTIAGQTAPGDGITVKGSMTSAEGAHDVVIRYLRFRPGDSVPGDALQLTNVSEAIADHISASWSTNDLLSVLDSSNITVQWSVLADSLNNTNTLHGYGSQLRYGAGTLSFHHNLYADNYSANPRLGDNLSLDFVNNVIYNWGIYAGYSGSNDLPDNPGGFTNQLNYVCNYLIAGPDTAFYSTNIARTNIAFWGGTNNTWIFQTNNFIDSDTNGILNGANTGWGMFTNLYTRFGHPFPLPPIDVDEAFLAYEKVLDFAGASQMRDSVDTNIIGKVRNQSGVIISAQSGWPTLNSAPPWLDSDRDGLPDFWEITFGQNPASASNNLLSTNVNNIGYTDLEEYLNWLAAPHALTVTDAPVAVNLYSLAGETGDLAFFVTNAVNGTVYLTNVLGSVTNTGPYSNSIAVFTPATGYSGYASFDFYVTNSTTVAHFGPVTVSVVVSATSIVAAGGTNLVNDVVQTNIILANSINYYPVSVPANADVATNLLLFANGPLNLLFNQTSQPTGVNPGDYTLFGGLTNAAAILSTTSLPTNIIPGQTYWLGVQNTNNFSVTYSLEVDFHFASSLTSPTNVIISNIAFTNIGGTNGFLLTWFAPTNYQFQVQWTTNLASTASWTTVPGVVLTNLPAFTPTNGIGMFQFFDDGSLSSGFGTLKFYRLIASLLVNTPSEVPIVNAQISYNGFHFQWSAPSNEQFEVEWTTNLTPPTVWSTNTMGITYTNGVFTFTDPNATNQQRFYRLIQLP